MGVNNEKTTNNYFYFNTFFKAEDSFLKGFYLGVDATANARGNESFASDPSINYKVDRGIQYSLGYAGGSNDIIGYYIGIRYKF